MGEHPPSPHLMPPPPSSLLNSNLPVLYYGLAVVGTAGIVLALYNLVVLKWCTNFSTNGFSGQRAMITGRGGPSRNLNLDLVSSFKYNNGVSAQDRRNDSECAVCLSVFEEGEELRQLPICNHSFHAPCIDMWLYSHMNCPICRCPVEPPVLPQSTAVGQPQQPPSVAVPPNIQPLQPPQGLQGRGISIIVQ